MKLAPSRGGGSTGGGDLQRELSGIWESGYQAMRDGIWQMGIFRVPFIQ
jgi:hypothetical protein